MKSHKIICFNLPTVTQGIFYWTFNLNEDFAKGKYMAYQTTSAAVLLLLGTQ